MNRSQLGSFFPRWVSMQSLWKLKSTTAVNSLSSRCLCNLSSLFPRSMLQSQGPPRISRILLLSCHSSCNLLAIRAPCRPDLGHSLSYIHTNSTMFDTFMFNKDSSDRPPASLRSHQATFTPKGITYIGAASDSTIVNPHDDWSFQEQFQFAPAPRAFALHTQLSDAHGELFTLC